MSCSTCGEEGHHSPTCRWLQQRFTKSACPEVSKFCNTFASKCGTCGKAGHYSPTCPKVQKKRTKIDDALAQAKISQSFDCYVCNKSLNSAGALWYHLENDVCQDSDTQQGSVSGTCGGHDHYSPKHPRVTKFCHTFAGKCSTCGKVGHYSPTCPKVQKKRTEIDDALAQAKISQSFDCYVCNKSLNSAGALWYHLENDVCKNSDMKHGGVSGTCGGHDHYSSKHTRVTKFCHTFAVTCSTCGKEGHYSPTCPKLQDKCKEIADALVQAKISSSFDCDVCSKSLNSAQALRYHLENDVCKGPEARFEHIDCLEALENTKFERNMRPGLKILKPRARKATKDFALTLGAVNSIGRGIRSSKATRLHESLARNVCRAIQRQRPDFPFTSVQVNKNSTSKLHVDSSNAGPSLIHGLGGYSGGELYVDRRGLLDVQNKWVEFDGNIPHFTNIFTGRRYTLIFFVHQSYTLLPKIDRQYLQKLGFQFPRHVMTKGKYGSRQSRINEARKRVPQELCYAMGPKRMLRKRRRIEHAA